MRGDQGVGKTGCEADKPSSLLSNVRSHRTITIFYSGRFEKGQETGCEADKPSSLLLLLFEPFIVLEVVFRIAILRLNFWKVRDEIWGSCDF